ncbi:MAG: EamA family transporter [Deltaproteobacteria bacterium]|nr:EamA family transporter [Deltaproteobacteria bacterium]
MSELELGMVLLSALLHAAWNLFAKGSRDPMSFSLVLSIVPALLLLPLLPFVDLTQVPPAVWKLLCVTGVCHGLYFLFLTMGYERGDLSLVYPISRSAPAFVTLAAVPLLGESVSPLGALGIAVVVVSMWLVQTEGRVRWHGFVEPGTRYAYLALLATVGFSLIDKRAMSLLSAAPWSSAVPKAVLYYFLLCAAAALVFVPNALRRLRPGAFHAVATQEGGRALISVVVSFASYALILEALRSASVSYVTATRQTSVLFAVALGIAFLHERPSRPRIVGAAGTVAGVILIAFA